jgi:hypothetical protein
MGAFPDASVAELEAAVLGSAQPGEPVRLNALTAYKALQKNRASGARAEVVLPAQ